MKTSASSALRHRERLNLPTRNMTCPVTKRRPEPATNVNPRQALPWITLLSIAALTTLTGCLSTSSSESSHSASSGAVAASNWRESGIWEKVRDSPETYFPAGVDRNHPTDFFSGEWVMGGVNDPIFYVPKSGSPNKSQSELMADARRIVGPYQRTPEPSSGPLALFGGGDTKPKKQEAANDDFDIAILQDGQLVGSGMPAPEADSSSEKPEPAAEEALAPVDPKPSADTSSSSSTDSASAGNKVNTDDFWIHRSFP